MVEKISNELKSRLEALNPKSRVQALVILATDLQTPARSRRLSCEERQVIADTIRQTSSEALDTIDQILVGHHGKRLAAGTSSLGTVPVETTVEGIRALAESDRVQAILEDQKISQLSSGQSRGW